MFRFFRRYHPGVWAADYIVRHKKSLDDRLGRNLREIRRRHVLRIFAKKLSMAKRKTNGDHSKSSKRRGVESTKQLPPTPSKSEKRSRTWYQRQRRKQEYQRKKQERIAERRNASVGKQLEAVFSSSKASSSSATTKVMGLTSAGTPSTRSGYVSAPVRPGKRVRLEGPRQNITKRGCYVTLESSKKLESGSGDYKIAIVGHATCPAVQLVNFFAYCLIKSITIKMNVAPADLTDDIPGLANGDAFYLGYRADNASAPTTIAFPRTAVTQTTYSHFAQAIALWIRNNGTVDTQYLYLEFRPNTPVSFTTKIWLTNARMKFDAKSTLKFQNRTTEETTDHTTDAVDAVPLQGRQYEGRGTGSKYFDDTTNTPILVADKTFGTIATAGNGEIQEPPPPYELQFVKGSGSVKHEPGEIITSVLRDTFEISVQRLMRLVLSPATNPITPLGKFRFFIMEKMIALQTNTQKITLAVEHNLLFGGELINGKQTYTKNIVVELPI